MPVQVLVGRADVGVLLGIVAKMTGAEEAGITEVEVGDRKISFDASLLQGRYVLAGAVPGVACDLTRFDVPAKDGVPEQVEHGAVLGNLRGRDQDIEDDPGLSSIHDMVNLVAEAATGFRPAHRGGIGIGLRRPRVGDAWPIAALEGAVLPPGPGNPIALSS